MMLAFVAAALTGSALTVIDGDTVDYFGMRLRIAGIDAPETWPGQYECLAERAAGRRASHVLRNILETGPADIWILGRAWPGNRWEARIEVGGEDVAEALVRAGVARVWRGRRRAWSVCNSEAEN